MLAIILNKSTLTSNYVYISQIDKKVNIYQYISISIIQSLAKILSQ